MKKKTVVVGMSGGVDSSVSALLLQQQGYDVIGMFMKNWEEASGACHSAQDFEDVVSVCNCLKIPYYTVNFVNEYRDLVFSHFLAQLKEGLTPNPDILCNREIKFKLFLKKALDLGADYLATGHYCRIGAMERFATLLKGTDTDKDQSYFLYTLNSSTLQKVLFPIGHLRKSEVRALAKQHALRTFSKKDSTGICFIGKRNFKSFIGQFLGYQRGNFENINGTVIGQHDGVAYYTLGQRKGLGIGGPGEAWFVVGKDPARNVVIIEQGSDHPSLYKEQVVADDLNWITGALPVLPYSCQAKVRYRQPQEPCVIEKIEGTRVYVRFHTPQRAITPCQSIVFYDGDTCLGGGIIIS